MKKKFEVVTSLFLLARCARTLTRYFYRPNERSTGSSGINRNAAGIKRPFADAKIDHGRDHEMSLSFPLLLVPTRYNSAIKEPISSSGRDSLAPLQVAGRRFLGRT